MNTEDRITRYECDPVASLRYWSTTFNQKVLPPLVPAREPVFSSGWSPEESNPSFLLGDQTVIQQGRPAGGLPFPAKAEFPAAPRLVDGSQREFPPFGQVGKLFFVRDVGGEPTLFSGTAFTVPSENGNVVVTAAHCLFSEGGLPYSRQWSRHLIFIPRFSESPEGTKPYFDRREVYPASELRVSHKWIEGKDYNRYEYDFGCVVLVPQEERGKALQEVTGGLGWLAGPGAGVNSEVALALGYPGGANFSRGLWQAGVRLSFQQFVTGHPHLRLRHHSFTHGASGGPVVIWLEELEEYAAVGLHASVTRHPSGLQYWDSPRFGHEFIGMLRGL